jgi:hypothetical protein
MSAPDRRAMLDRADKVLSLRRQCALLGKAVLNRANERHHIIGRIVRGERRVTYN